MNAPLRVGSGLDVHAFADTSDRPLILCGVEVPDGPALVGHSDADVGTHAVIDAVLGAAARGDLGSRFGVDQPETAGADSLDLLATVVAELRDLGLTVGNLDVTLIAQRPRLAAYREPMRANLARVCRLDPGQVSVKFTSTDRLGTVGRGEGVAAWCTCLLMDARSRLQARP